MSTEFSLPAARDKLLFTPGPLTTSLNVKTSMLHDYGSRDQALIEIVRDIRARLLDLAGVSPDDYTAIPMQGSGTFAIEAMIGSVLPPDGKLLVAVNGAYGARMVQIAHVLNIAHTALPFGEDEPVEPTAVAEALAADPAITHVAVVHCETTTGLINPVEAIGAVTHAADKVYLVDAMSSFGGMPLAPVVAHIDYLVSSANKCIEGVPGFGFVIARRADLARTRGYARSLSLDLLAQVEGLDANGQFRFTPPTHVLVAFHQALLELEAEGGIPARHARYQTNQRRLVQGMQRLGFRPYLAADRQGPIITAFHYPDHPSFDFARFYAALNARGFVIYPGKLSQVDCFRIGNIGRINSADIDALLAAIAAVLHEHEINLEPLTLPLTK